MRKFADRLLAIGTAVTVIAASAAMHGPAQAQRPAQAPPIRVAQSQTPIPDPMAGQPQQPALPQTALPQAAFPQAAPQPQVYTPPISAEIPKPFHGSMTFEAGAGKILTLTLPAANIYVADPKVAEVRPASSTSLFVFGIGPGHTTIAAVDALGRLLADYQITVHPSGFGAREAQGAISRLIPGSRVQVKAQGKGIMLTGGVANAADAAQAMTIAKGYVSGEGAMVDNQMTIAMPSQVTLQVRIAEMKRSVARNIGIDWAASGFFGKISPYPYIAAGAAAVGVAAPAATPAVAALRATFNGGCSSGGIGCFDSILNALAKDGLAHVLAEPNLTVMSGQPASFQAGGEFPYQTITGTGSSATPSIVFKQYGVLLHFVPTVLSDSRINLHVRPEVSQIDTTNVLTSQNGSSVALAAPALTTRRAETTVEMGSGESFAIAGMLQTTSSNNGSGIPGLGDTPILGALFKTNQMTREQTELVIVITPILVRPVSNGTQLQLPAEGYKLPTDIDRLLLMRQMPNRNGTTQVQAPGQAGFIVR